jgi:hypothetical protein
MFHIIHEDVFVVMIALQEILQLAAVLEGFCGGSELPQYPIATVGERSQILVSAALYKCWCLTRVRVEHRHQHL